MEHELDRVVDDRPGSDQRGSPAGATPLTIGVGMAVLDLAVAGARMWRRAGESRGYPLCMLTLFNVSGPSMVASKPALPERFIHRRITA